MLECFYQKRVGVSGRSSGFFRFLWDPELTVVFVGECLVLPSDSLSLDFAFPLGGLTFGL